MLKIKAPAKVNWYLEIPGKRPDGFHEIYTVMQAIDLCDDIVVQDRSDATLSLTCNIDLGPVETNLVYRAARLLQTEQAPRRGASIALTKRTPHGAGLGGGSSDASATLVALNRLWALGLGADRLRELAANIGSDCAFFIDGGTALCTGRGEQVQQLHDQPGLPVVILYPNEVCPTKEVYADLAKGLNYAQPDCYLFHVFEGQADPAKLALVVTNRLQASALRVSKRLAEVWGQTAQENGVLVRFVSGSGSSVAFLMSNAAASVELVKTLTKRGLGQAFATQTLPRGPVWG